MMKEMRATFLVEISIVDGRLVRSNVERRMEIPNLALTLAIPSKGVIMAESATSAEHAIGLAEEVRRTMSQGG